MGFLSQLNHRTPIAPATLQPPVVEVLSFERVCARGRAEEGAVISVAVGGCARRVRVAMTWEALAVLREKALRAGDACHDPALIAAVLKTFTRERVQACLSSGVALPFDGFLLSVDGRQGLQLEGLMRRSRLVSEEQVLRPTVPRRGAWTFARPTFAR